MEKTCTIVIGKNERNDIVLLSAPDRNYFDVGDEVIYPSITGAATKATIIFESSYTPVDGELYTALTLALQMNPRKIVEKVVHERIEWKEDEDAVDG